jgi:hypothetical protein
MARSESKDIAKPLGQNNRKRREIEREADVKAESHQVVEGGRRVYLIGRKQSGAASDQKHGRDTLLC